MPHRLESWKMELRDSSQKTLLSQNKVKGFKISKQLYTFAKQEFPNQLPKECSKLEWLMEY